jgi:hypothetical protein
VSLASSKMTAAWVRQLNSRIERRDGGMHGERWKERHNED